ncbi:MAG TPA: amidohydrolase family protein [Streptosporangiaceae bacterium]|jgi:imidazolonepropionase-like amidohydrolase
MERIDADLLIPGSGEPVRDGTVLIDGGVISYAGPAASAPPADGAVTHRAAAVLPGLWDCHTHLFGSREMDLARQVQEPVALRAARCAHDLMNAVNAGVTSVREVGGLGVYLAKAVSEGTLTGPAIYAAGAVLSTTGGHGDLHCYPLSWVEDFSRADGSFRLADGTAECMRAVREQLRRGAAVIKVCASGGVLSEVDNPVHQQFTGDELRAIVEVAGMADRVVAAHCHGKPGIMAALEAGVATIEHGTYLDEEACDAMRETGAILVPTRTIIEDILANLDRVPPYAAEKLTRIAQTHADMVRMAIERGVPIAMGTDILMTGMDLPYAWGSHGIELVHMVSLGMTPLQAIEAATATGPRTLGPQAPRSGLLAAGYDADVITVDGDPVADISVLAAPDRVTGVWRGGQQVKGAGARQR